MSEASELMDVLAVPDTFVSGLGSVEPIGGGNWRFTMFVNQEIGGNTVRVVVAKIVVSIDAVPEGMHMSAMATSTCACENARRMIRN
jgi:hypothetical protein